MNDSAPYDLDVHVYCHSNSSVSFSKKKKKIPDVNPIYNKNIHKH